MTLSSLFARKHNMKFCFLISTWNNPGLSQHGYAAYLACGLHDTTVYSFELLCDFTMMLVHINLNC